MNINSPVFASIDKSFARPLCSSLISQAFGKIEFLAFDDTVSKNDVVEKFLAGNPNPQLTLLSPQTFNDSSAVCMLPTSKFS